MNPELESLKSELVKDIDGILNAPFIIQRFLSPEYKKVLHAMRDFWNEADEATMIKFKQLHDREL